MPKPKTITTDMRPKTLLLGIEAPYNKTKNIQSYFDEFVNLAKSNNVRPDEVIFIRLRQIDSGYFLTKGKLEEIRKICQEKDIEEVIVSESLTTRQERNLNELFCCRVFDRTQLILEIFEKSAQSAEGKLQVGIAMLSHKKSRIAGQGIHMSQQSGHIGGRGPGETAKEQELRHIDNLILKLKRQLKSLEKTRDVQRKRRMDTNVTRICLIGYTNTGKSTLFNQLTKADVLAQDKLFATLDTTTRELFIKSKKKGIISDTVGFIQQLPHTLVEAFKSTLDELKYANLLLQVVDIADTNWKDHIKIVNRILKELAVKKPMLYVFNKADKPVKEHIPLLDRELFQPNVVISSTSKAGIKPLINFLHSWNVDKKVE